VHITVSNRPQAKKRPRAARAGPADETRRRGQASPLAGHAIVIRYVDDAIVTVEKPSGLTTVRHADEEAKFGQRAKRFLPLTLADLLPAVLRARYPKLQGRPRAVHRLDKETSGLVVFALTSAAESALGQQFRGHSVGRRYLALVRGKATEGRIESYFVSDRGDARRGSSRDGKGQHAVTHVRVLEDLGAYTLVECRLETGRTHQVRIHLGEQGTPLCGERVYDRSINGKPLPDDSGARRPMLHAAYLAIDHPVTCKRMEWQSAPPDDMDKLLRSLRKSHRSRDR
jgi:23S rRNA pseudouridine1911/1915/1917 synthase